MKKRLRDFVQYKENPFSPKNGLADLCFKTKFKPVISTRDPDDTRISAINVCSGEVLGHLAWYRHDQVDEDTFVKLFVKHLGAFLDLSTAGIRVLMYILLNLRPNHDLITFDIDECCQFCKYSSPNSVRKGLVELLDAQIIARGKNEYFYFINYHIVFNGDRYKFVYDVTKKGNPK